MSLSETFNWADVMQSNTVADPGFGQGGAPEIFSQILPTQRSELYNIGRGPGPALGISSCIFNYQICILPLFLVLFLQFL